MNLLNYATVDDNLKPSKRRLIRRLLIAGGVIAASAILVALIGFLFLWWAFSENSFSKRAAGAVVTQVMNGTLVPNGVGIVRLPPALASNSCDGQVYVTVDPAGTTWILFPTSQGKGSNLLGYLYRSTPATGPPPQEINVIGPGVPRSTTGRLNYAVESQIDANWYHVNWDWD